MIKKGFSLVLDTLSISVYFMFPKGSKFQRKFVKNFMNFGNFGGAPKNKNQNSYYTSTHALL